ncbi:MAG: Tad domain-containing protein, partial [Paracoccaceae bacterium]|nr:Tad domain-containing protein [Paracoccaceae bacterium]
MRRGHLKTRFLKEDQGSMTVFGLYLFIGIMMIGALAVDVASAYMARTQLQVAADATAHAALYLREDNSSSDSKAMALNLTSVNMPSSKFGTVLSTSDMHFGY